MGEIVMAIIKCMECGHDVSTFAEKCPNCGCPVSILVGDTGKNDKYDVILVDAGDNKLQVIRFIRELSIPPKGLAEAKEIVDNTPCAIIHSASIEDAQCVVSKLAEIGCYSMIDQSDSELDIGKVDNSSNIKSTFLFTKDQPLKCPRCGSTAVATTSRGYSLIWGFIGSNKTINRCGKCGNTWRP